MIKMIADASLPDLSHLFPTSFQVTRFVEARDLREQISDQDVLLCRSTLKVDADLLAESRIACVATVSSGTDHISAGYVAQRKIHVIDAKGTNASAVADYVVACLASLQQQGFGGQQAGVIGMGAVGTTVTTRLQELDFQVHGYDPLRAMQDTQFSTCDLNALLVCDLLCVHANLHDQVPYASRHLLDATFLSQLKPGTVIINAARGGIVDESALLACTQPLRYCTDVYVGEPNIRAEVIEYATLCTPHIAGHSIEAKRRALQEVSQKIYHWFGLPAPILPHLAVQLPQRAPSTAWQANILSLYNPEHETQILKKARDLPKEFLALRAAHQGRHDFNCYVWLNGDKILGV
ncbi:MAG: 4-phosphoerythronate dehydrogenase [Legionellales bacterium]|nr:4-phosphoerythronate dehydrogenase [Legionellales bacterium]